VLNSDAFSGYSPVQNHLDAWAEVPTILFTRVLNPLDSPLEN
jgi:hypothetical protein